MKNIFQFKKCVLLFVFVVCSILTYAQAPVTDLTIHEPTAAPPAGATFEWREGELSSSPLVSDPTAVAPGLYYGFYNFGDGCFSQGTPISVITNTCPITTGDLSTAVDPAPAGVTLSYHVSLPVSAANEISGTAVTEAPEGTYYVAYKSPEGCYSNANPVVMREAYCGPCDPVAQTTAVGATLGSSGINGICVGCSVTGESNLVDTDLSNSASINIAIGVASSGFIEVDLNEVFPSGTRAGFIADVNGGVAGLFNGVTLTTYLNGVEQESASGGNLVNILGLGGGQNIAAVFCEPFDKIRITAGSLAGVFANYQIFNAFVEEGCEYDTVCDGPCDVVEQTTEVGATLEDSGISGFCLLCSISGEDNVVDANLSNSASINIAVGVFSSGFIDINLNEVFPAGTRAGFVADVNGGIAGLFNGVTLSTYLNGTFQESISGGSLINILGIGGNQNIAGVFCEPFDRIRITAGSLAGVFANYKIYNAFVVEDCLYPVACGEAPGPEICDDGIDNDGDGSVDEGEDCIDYDCDYGLTSSEICAICNTTDGTDQSSPLCFLDCDNDGAINRFECDNSLDPLDPDTDGDGNPDGQDPNPTVPTVADDSNTGTPDVAGTTDILANDDYLPNNDPTNLGTTSITDTGNGTADGTIVFDPEDGTLDYTPTTAEAGTDVTIVYQVCNDESGSLVCEEATVTITVSDLDCNAGLTATEICDICNTTDGTDQGNSLCALDCDSDGATNGAECDNGTDPTDPDTDGDGNPDGTDPNPTVPTAADDSNVGAPDLVGTTDILSNDDYLPNNDPTNLGTTSITDTGNGTADGTIVFDPEDGTLDYTPTAAEAGMDVTVVYEVCNDESGSLVCEEATVTITVVDYECNSFLTGLEICELCNTTDGTNQGSTICALDCDSDGLTASNECDAGLDPTDPDTDGDGNPDGTDPNPTVPTAADDSNTGTPDVAGTTDILANDDYLPNNDPTNLGTTSITDTGNGTADGTIVFDPEDGTLDYTPTVEEAGMDVTVVYEVCNDESGSLVCEEATVTITVADLDCDSGLTASEICELCNTTDGTNQGSAICALDCDSDGSITSDECDNGTDPTDPDTDGDGNPDGTDPNPTVPTAADDSNTATPEVVSTTDILANDDYLPNNDPTNLGTTSITDTGNGTADGTIVLDPEDGTLDYTPTAAEAGMDVTVVYEVCNDESGSLVCEEATVTITVLDLECNSGLTASEICELCNTTNGTNQGSAICSLDCDSDGITASDECDNGTDPTDPDTDGDGNPDGTDPNPTVPTAADDSNTGTPEVAGTTDILANDDYLPNNDPTNLGTTSITDTGNGTADGTIVLDPQDGTLDYTPTAAEAGMDVTVVYEVCNDESGSLVCEEATVTITVLDLECNSGLTASEICELCNTTNGTNQGSAICSLDCDSDGITASDECDNGTDPTDPDTDGDGNPDGTDPNPTVPTAADDSNTGTPEVAGTTDILANDDYLPNNDPTNLGTTSITDTGNGSAEGTIVFDPEDGTLDYTPTVEEGGMDVTIVYEVCNDESGTLVCEEATVTITVEDNTDTDGDGEPDITDIDDDNDGIPDVVEAATAPANGDTDGDGIPDTLDLDSDNDGIADIVEAGGTDTNNDGLVDDPTDSDNDGLADVADVNPAVEDEPTTLAEGLAVTELPVPDTDGDGQPDFQDLDSDNDGINDIEEAGIADVDNNGIVDDVNPDGTLANDPDGDGWAGSLDPTTGGTPVVPVDTDGDETPDYLDLDSDNDGINDVIEGGNGLFDTDNDGVIEGPDLDNDGILDVVDQTPTDFGDGDTTNPNEAPTDTDGDMIPDYQDLDSDNDSINDTEEAGLPDPNGDGLVDDPLTDTDGDGIPDSVDEAPGVFGDAPGNADNPTDTNGDGTPDFQELDSDDDGTLDIVEGGDPTLDPNGDGVVDDTTDPDGDGIVGGADLDPNNFGDAIDTDGDGIPDAIDIDDDNDGIPDVVEAATAPANGDTDGDGIPDTLDLDSDNDGIPDILEAGGTDANNDGLVDDPTDADNDGLADVADVNPGVADDPTTLAEGLAVTELPVPDTDGDGQPDFQDLDSDNDGINDIEEAGIADVDNNGIVDDVNPDGTLTDDPDGDGWAGSLDPTTGGTPVVPVDTDGDETPDYLDLDSDNDGINDVIEGGNGLFDTDNDGVIEGPDLDNDGILDVVDQTPTDFGDGDTTNPNEAPTDTDGDMIPDYQDLDSDNDSINDTEEAGLPDPNGDGLVDDPLTDTDGDGIPDSVDEAPGVFGDAPGNADNPTDTNGDGTPDFQELDSDDDGTLDIVEGGDPTLDPNGDGVVDDTTDPDGDGIVGGADLDPNNFGDAVDTDGDGVPDSIDIDDDNDGIPDVVEAATAPANGDTDGDGIPDTLDLDSDNDGIADIVEAGGTDADNDGLVDDPTDADEDGLADVADVNPGVADDPTTLAEGLAVTELPVPDTDGDGQPDFQDLDSDNDGINDIEEAGIADVDNNGIVDDVNPDGTLTDDPDGDGWAGSLDPTTGGTPVVPVDTDGDETPDYLDLDSDNDGINDVIEGGNGLFDTDSDGVIEGPDSDNDGIPDVVDQTPDTYGDGDAINPNEAPTDTDGDMIPDYQDLDSDNDSINDTEEAGLPDPNGDGLVDDPLTDTDGDGIPDSVDGEPGIFGDEPGVLDNPTDTDGDGTPDFQEVDSDDDGTPDIVEGGEDQTLDGDGDGVVDDTTDPDGDGIVGDADLDPNNFGDAPDPDTDGDGNPDSTDPNPTVPTVADDSNTGTPDVLVTTDILSNDDYLPNNDPTNLGTTSITDTGDGTADGIIMFDPEDGTLDYTPTAAEAGMDVTVVYEVCNDESGILVCAEATVTISVSDFDCDSGLTSAEICELCNTTDGTNQGSAICALDCDDDELTSTEECDGGTDPNDPDTDGDGNPDGQDPNPTVPTAADDIASGTVGEVTTEDILSNDDYLPNNDPTNLGTTSITDTGDGTAEGTIVLDPEDGTLDYTPTAAEAGMVVTVVYEVCNDETGSLVCEQATVTITVADEDCNTGLTSEEICELCNTTDGTNQGSAICDLDCDNDGLTAAEECDGGTDPNDPDTDGDGNPDGQDPNPLVPTTADDTDLGVVGDVTTTDILANDDFLANNDPTNLGTTTITDTGDGTAVGVIDFDPFDGTLDYTPAASEAGKVVTVVYEVCNDETGALVCAEATVTYTVADLDCDSGLTAAEICELCNTTDGTNQGSALCDLDCDSDGSTNSNECDNGTNPLDPCDPAGSAVDVDCDNDGLTNNEELDPTIGTDPTNPDTDGDGINDGDEVDGGSNPLDPCDPNPIAIPNGDCDNDGLTNIEEVITYNTDPTDPDTDNDGINDGDEVDGNSEPLDPCDPNPNALASNNCSVPNADGETLVVAANTTSSLDPLANDDFGLDGPGVGPITIVNGPTIGSATVNDGGTPNDPTDDTIDFTPPTGYEGTSSITYEICDEEGDCDQATIILEILIDPACVDINTSVLLEGPYVDNGSNGLMTTKLNNLGYLPGQNPSTFFGTRTPAGQPYFELPWQYNGMEGEQYNADLTGDDSAGYGADVTDWVLVSLRSSVSETSTVCTQAALLKADGLIEFVPGPDCCEIDENITYYIVIEHRNHLIVMSDEKRPVVNGVISYDFRTQQSYKSLFGFAQKQIGTDFVMYAGNGEQTDSGSSDVDINVKDKSEWLDENGSNSSYFFYDFDLNGDVNVQDKNLWLDNNGKFSDVPR